MWLSVEPRHSMFARMTGWALCLTMGVLFHFTVTQIWNVYRFVQSNDHLLQSFTSIVSDVILAQIVFLYFEKAVANVPQQRSLKTHYDVPHFVHGVPRDARWQCMQRTALCEWPYDKSDSQLVLFVKLRDQYCKREHLLCFRTTLPLRGSTTAAREDGIALTCWLRQKPDDSDR